MYTYADMGALVLNSYPPWPGACGPVTWWSSCDRLDALIDCDRAPGGAHGAYVPANSGRPAMTAAELSPDQLRRDPLPLRGRTALVTGVSRRAGIGYAVARRLAALGASLFLHHYAPHDRDQPWGEDPGGAQAVVAGVRDALAVAGASAHHVELDLALPEAPDRLIEAAADALGHLDILVCNHARSGYGPLGTLDA